jgi:uncharacterized repeat protein (TIGR03803 family)
MMAWMQSRSGISRKSRIAWMSLLMLALFAALFSMQATAQTFIELYPFNSASVGLADGAWPEAGVVRDSAGNLYGTTFFGGTGTGCDINEAGCGVVFKVDPTGKETVLHIFGGAHDGWNPTGSLILDAAGNLYGTTQFGGLYGYGTVFKIDPAGNETILHSFRRGLDGANPAAGLVQDASGNLYGTTRYGGVGCNTQGCGTVFKISPTGQETILHRFRDGADGASPLGVVAVDSSGDVYGSTWVGGIFNYGTVFKIDMCGEEKVLHHFSGGSDGANPIGGVTLDQAGNLYGTTSAGGAFIGTVFTVNTAGNESIVYTFTGGLDGAYPYANLILDASGNLYGTASQGGSTDAGSVFELTGGTLTVLYDFAGTTDGANPMGGLTMDSSGNLYGTAVQQGLYGWGAVFEIQRSLQ